MAGQGQMLPDHEDSLHPAVKDVLRFFDHKHLPPTQRAIAEPFQDLAWRLALGGLKGAQLTISLQLLLQSKDAAVRASL